MTIKLFISYRSTDSAKVDDIVSHLASLKAEDGSPRYVPWQDKYGIPAGKDWWEAIVDAIIDCNIFVFHVSLASLKSDVCRAELQYARERNRFIVPVVLPDEFTINPLTGKGEIAYWDQIPASLNDFRTQFLFHKGASFFAEFEQSVAQYENESQRWRDIKRPHPIDPRADSDGTQDSIALYDEACDYAGRLELETARKLFQKLIQRNDADFGDDAFQWIELLGQYERLLAMDSKASTRYRVRSLWNDYQKLFPKPFIEGIFDPKGFQERAVRSEPKSPLSHPDVQSPASQFSAQNGAPPPDAISPQRSKDAFDANTDDDSNRDVLRKMLNSRSARATDEMEAISVENITISDSLDLMPAPFAWISIPSGKVTLEKGGYLDKDTTFDVPAFQIAKYPITNAQFAKFIEADGYSDRYFWTDRGWALRESEKWTEPRYWHDKMWNGLDQPVVGISWFECVAFCQWLSETSNERITLLTEQQWQRAAQGDKPIIYPWGSHWDKTRCNSLVDKDLDQGRSTPVTQYDGKGDSPYGVSDMIGNVWEWCATSYIDGSREIHDKAVYRVARGGAWDFNDSNLLRVATRLRLKPETRSTNTGFRCVSL